MKMSWGALDKVFPLTEGERGNLYLDCKKTHSLGRSFQAFFFNQIGQAKPSSVLPVGCLLYTHG